MDFAFPLLSLLRANSSERIVKQRIMDICEYNSQLAQCLQKCPESAEKQILFHGIEPWLSLCSSWDVFVGELACWREHIDALTTICYSESQKLRRSMEKLTRNVTIHVVDMVCQDLNTLAACNIAEYGRLCGSGSKQLISKLFQISRESMAKMLQVKWNEMHDECIRDIETTGPQVTLESNNSNTFFPIRIALILFLVLSMVM
ncbi:hypothetical protein Ddc_05115 [Ditylenchus destructor]|nr:hypothetical protein Ddc_05115 [Ditylenchus destructor]